VSAVAIPRVLLAAAVALGLWALPSKTQAQTQSGFQIAGRVVNSVTGEPVSLATVNALTESSNGVVATGTTDADGRFVLTGLAAGKYPLTASRRGFRTCYYDEHEESFNTAIVTGPDQDTTHLIFKLAPGAVIYGTVTGEGGDPVQEASVMLFRREQAAPTHPPVKVEPVATDDIGAYEFDDLPAGEYFLAVQARPWYAVRGSAQGTLVQTSGQETPPLSQNALDVSYPITFYDSTTEEDAATPLEVDAGSRIEADISLHAVAAVRLTVPHVQMRNGPSIAVRHTVFGSHLPMPFDIESIGRGPWTIQGLPPGHYDVYISNPPRTVQVDATTSMDIDPATGVPPQPVDGTIRMADGSPPGEVALTLSQVDSNAPAPNASVNRGQFHFPSVQPGVWTLSASSSSGNLYVASVAGPAGPLPAGQIAVRDRPVILSVVLTRSQASITGFVRDRGKPVPGAMIVLVPRNPAAWPALARRDQSDSDGSFSLADVSPGRYTVIAIANGWNLDWQDRSVIGRYLHAGQDVTIGIQTGGVVRLPQPVQPVSP
jgi:hypothetical protein